AAKPHTVGGIVMAAAGALYGDTGPPRTECAVDGDPSTVARAPRQHVAIVDAATAITRIGVAQLRGQVEAGQRRVVAELRAADARLVDVAAHAEVVRWWIDEHDQVIDAALVDVERPVVVAERMRHA